MGISGGSCGALEVYKPPPIHPEAGLLHCIFSLALRDSMKLFGYFFLLDLGSAGEEEPSWTWGRLEKRSCPLIVSSWTWGRLEKSLQAYCYSQQTLCYLVPCKQQGAHFLFTLCSLFLLNCANSVLFCVCSLTAYYRLPAYWIAVVYRDLRN